MSGNKVSPSQTEKNIEQVQGLPSDLVGKPTYNHRDTTQWIQQDINVKTCLWNGESDKKNMCDCGQKNQQNKSDEERTNYFGEIAFGNNHTAKYIRVHSNTSETSNVLKTIKEQWLLEIPDLLISVYGNTKSFENTSLAETCQTSLTKAVHGTGSWIITDGKQEYVNTDETADEKPIIIVISQWGAIHNKIQMDNNQGSNPAKYPIDKSSLDPNYSHFILVDDGHQDASNTEINFRDELESAISKIESVPLVLLVLEWNEKIKETVQNALTKKIPVVIVMASDGEAYGLSSDSEIPKDISKHKLTQICEWNSESDDFDIGLAILKALSKANKNNERDKITNGMYQLKLAFAWNRIDIAKKNISREIIKLKVQRLDDFMLTAILMDRMEFVELLLHNEFDLKMFLTHKRLEKSYNTNPAFKEILTKMRSSKKEEFSLKKVVKDMAQYLCDDISLPFTRYVNRGNEDTHQSTESMQADGSEQTQPDGDDPYLDLLIFSVLNHCQNVAKFFWRRGKDAVAAALFADAILYAMSHQIGDKSFKDNYEKHRREFTNLAIGVLKECVKDNVNNTTELLVQQFQWRKTSSFMIIVKSENKQVLTDHAFQSVFDNIWMGQLDEDNDSLRGYLKLILCILIPPLILVWISFKYEKQAHVPPSSEKTRPNSRQPPTRGPTTTSNNSKTIQETNCCRSICQRFKSFYLAPVIIFIHHIISYIIFLGLFSYILICKFDRYLSWQEIVLCVWVFTIFTQEVIQVCRTPSKDWSSRFCSYIRDGWNKLDFITVILFLIGMILRIVDHPQVAATAHIVLGVNMITFYLRLLHIFYVNRELGPKLIMIMGMVNDLISITMIVLVFIVAYGIASHAILYPHTEPSFATFTEIFRRSYWNIYGELMLDKIEGSVDCTNDPALYNSGSYSRCPTESGKYFVPLLMGVYMMMSNILLLNLLIAMFSFTFEKVQVKSYLYWRYQQFSLINEYENRPFLAPPLSIFVHIWWFIRCVTRRIKRCCEVNADEQNDFLRPRSYCQDLREWEKKMAETFYKQELEHNSNPVNEAVSPNLEKRMDNIEKQLNWIVTTLKENNRGDGC